MGSSVSTAPELANLVARLADNKYYLGLRYAEWCTAAPTLESAVAAASMAQTEIGHARSLYPLLQDVAGLSPETEAETRTRFVQAPFLRRPFEGWTDFVAANFLFDTALTILLEAAQRSSFTDLASRARRMLEEEPLHWLHGEGWARRLAGQGDAVRAALLSSFDGVIPDALEWFDVAREPLIADGIVDAGSEELRRRFRARINPVLSAAGLPGQ
jgi:phenylacetate-CoA oxygenase PaaI subunit